MLLTTGMFKPFYVADSEWFWRHAQVSMYCTLLFSAMGKVHAISQAKRKPNIFLELVLLVEMKSYTNLELVFTLLPCTLNFLFHQVPERPHVSLNNTPAVLGSRYNEYSEFTWDAKMESTTKNSKACFALVVTLCQAGSWRDTSTLSSG